MATIKQPSKEDVRSWMAQRRAENSPPPSPAEVRRALGWNLKPEYDPLRRDFPR